MTDRAFWNRKKVLVTGHTGFKGGWLSLWLESLGAEVTGYSLEAPTDPSLFKLSGLEKRMKSVIGNIKDLERVKTEFQKSNPEIIFHMAAQSLVRASYSDPVDTYATNVMGTVNVLESARKLKNLRAVCVVTSDKCYENREWTWAYRENEAMGGFDPYSSSKGCAELVTSAYRRSFFENGREVGIASGRAGNVIGGGDWALDRLIPDCVRALSGGKPVTIRNPKSIRPWQHVLEPLSGYMTLVENLWKNPAGFSEGWNFGPESTDAKPVSWIADRMTKLWGDGAKWELHPSSETAVHEAHHLKLDCSLAREKLDWRPASDLSRSLEWVVEWYHAQLKGQSALDLTHKQIQQYEEKRKAL